MQIKRQFRIVNKHFFMPLHNISFNSLEKGDNLFDRFQFGHLFVSDRGTQFLHDTDDVIGIVVDIKGIIFKLLSDQVDVKHLGDLGSESHMLRQQKHHNIL